MNTSNPVKTSTPIESTPDAAAIDNPRAQKLFIRYEKAKATAAKLNARLEEIARAERQRRKLADLKAHQRLFFVLGKYVYKSLVEDGSWLELKFGDVAFRETLSARDLDRFNKILGNQAVEEDFAGQEDDAANEVSFDHDDLEDPLGDQ